jgi:hypothetical protein
MPRYFKKRAVAYRFIGDFTPTESFDPGYQRLREHEKLGNLEIIHESRASGRTAREASSIIQNDSELSRLSKMDGVFIVSHGREISNNRTIGTPSPNLEQELSDYARLKRKRKAAGSVSKQKKIKFIPGYKGVIVQGRPIGAEYEGRHGAGPVFGSGNAWRRKAKQEVVDTKNYVRPDPILYATGQPSVDPSTVRSHVPGNQKPSRRRVKLQRKKMIVEEQKRRQFLKDVEKAREAAGSGKVNNVWTPDDRTPRPSPWIAEDYIDDPHRTGGTRFSGRKTTPQQNAARSHVETRKQTSSAGSRVRESIDDAPDSVPTGSRHTGRNLINELTRATRRGIDDIASFELSDVKNLLKSTLRGVKGGKAYIKSRSFSEMLADAESFLMSSDMIDPRKALKSDTRTFNTIMYTVNSGITAPDRKFAYNMLDIIDDHDMLTKLAREIDPAGFRNVRITGHAGKEAVKSFLRGKLDGAKRLDTVSDEVDEFVGNLSNVRLNKKGRDTLIGMVDRIMNGDESWHDKGIERARRGEFHGNVAGISQTAKVGRVKGVDVVRRFDISAPYEYRQVFNGMEVIGADGKVQSGVINGLGFTKDALRELEASARDQASDVVGFEMHMMQQNELKFMQVARGRDAMGNLRMGSVGNLIFQASAQQRQKFERTSRHAFTRQFQLDIETSYGRRHWENEVIKLGGLDTGSADEAFSGIIGLREKGLHREFASIVRDGNVNAIIEHAERMRQDDDINHITQVAMIEKDRVKGSMLGDYGAIKETGRSFSRGERNTGIFAARALSDDDFDDVIRTLTQERVRQARTGGAITGLNVDKFDMRVIREQAWRTGEEYLARAQQARSQLAVGQTDTAEIKALQARADRMLGYSGRYTGSSWVAHETDGIKRMTSVLNKRIGRTVFSSSVPIADTLQVSDITSNLVRPLASLAVKNNATERATIAAPRIKEHFFGTGESGWIDMGDTRIKSQNLQAWGSRDQAVSRRMTSVLRNVDETELREAIRSAKNRNAGLDEGLTTLFEEMHTAGRSGDMKTVRKMMRQFDVDGTQDMLDALMDDWGKKKVADITERVAGAPASQESLMYSVDEVWNKMTSGFRDTDGQVFLSKTAHNARRDLRMIDIAEELAFSTFRNAGKFVGETIAKPTQQLIDYVQGIGRVSLPFVGYRGSDVLVGKVNALLPKLNGEGVLEGEFAEYMSKQIAALKDKARGTIGVEEKFLSRAMASQARQIKSIVGGSVEMARIQKGLKIGYGVVGLAGIAAGAIAAGTVHHRTHQDDESWRYAPTEDPKVRKLNQQRMSEAGIGRLTTEMSTRKNYSYNMRPDKHKHLFRGQ